MRHLLADTLNCMYFLLDLQLIESQMLFADMSDNDCFDIVEASYNRCLENSHFLLY